jgi:outer membrane lipoprotein LolB
MLSSVSGIRWSWRRNVHVALRAFFVFALTVILSACASLDIDAPTRVVTDSSRALGPSLDAFSISGRLVVKQGQRRDHLRFTWERTLTSDELLLNGPLGQGVARLTQNLGELSIHSRAKLELADGKVFDGENWQTLAQKVFGQSVPLDALPDWIRGAKPTWSGEQDQWQVAVTEARQRPATAYRQHQLAPRALQISKDDVVVNILIDSWGDEDE